MKTCASEAEKLRREIGGRRTRRGPLPTAVRERGKAYARGRAAAGATAAEIASELGVAEKTAVRWIRPDVSAALLPVRVVDGARPRATETGPKYPSGDGRLAPGDVIEEPAAHGAAAEIA